MELSFKTKKKKSQTGTKEAKPDKRADCTCINEHLCYSLQCHWPNPTTHSPDASRRPVWFYYPWADSVWGDKHEAVQFTQLETKCARRHIHCLFITSRHNWQRRGIRKHTAGPIYIEQTNGFLSSFVLSAISPPPERCLGGTCVTFRLCRWLMAPQWNRLRACLKWGGKKPTYFIAINWPQLQYSGQCFSIWPASSYQEAAEIRKSRTLRVVKARVRDSSLRPSREALGSDVSWYQRSKPRFPTTPVNNGVYGKATWFMASPPAIVYRSTFWRYHM